MLHFPFIVGAFKAERINKPIKNERFFVQEELLESASQQTQDLVLKFPWQIPFLYI